MQTGNRMQWFLRFQNALFVVLVLVLLGSVAWLGERYSIAFDWTANQRNSLTDESAALLEALPAPVSITAFASDDEMLRTGIRTLVERYQRVKPDIALEFVNPDLSPERARAAGVRFDGTLVIRYQGREEQISSANESTISQAIARLVRGKDAWAVFMTGHGERAHDGRANFDLATLGAELVRQGFRVQALNLARTALPDNTGILVVAGPRVAWLPAETARVKQYLDAGGNLLWLTDPEGVAPLPELEDALNIAVKPGTVVDATTQLLGVADPTIAVVTDYPAAGPAGGLTLMSLFPRAAALAAHGDAWTSVPFLRTLPESWRETGPLAGNVTPGENEEMGPLTVGIALERAKDAGTQRVVVIGDGDFASNAFIGNQGNRDLAVNIFNWLGAEDTLLDIHVKQAPDIVLDLGRGAQIAIAVGFLLLLPLALLGAGVLVSLRRRKR